MSCPCPYPCPSKDPNCLFLPMIPWKKDCFLYSFYYSLWKSRMSLLFLFLLVGIWQSWAQWEEERTRQLYCTGGYHEVTWLLKWGTLLLFFNQHDEATAPFSNLNLVWWTPNNALIESVKGCLACLLVVDHLWKIRIMT